MKTLLLDYAKHNLWATNLYIEFLKSQNPALLEKELVSSFPSIIHTIVHIHAAQNIWCARLHNEVGSFPKYESFKSNEEIFENWLQSSTELLNFVHQVTNNELIAIKKFTLLNGSTNENEVKDMLLHCINHSNFHRGQLVTLMRQVGITNIPASDYIKYKRN
jgi:uncharacterized damage-inducible protein DinB